MKENERITVTELTQTCDMCPSQWEGRTLGGGCIYVRYRWGHLSIGTGRTIAEAVASRKSYEALSEDGFGTGFCSYSDLKQATGDYFIWPRLRERTDCRNRKDRRESAAPEKK